MQQAQVNLLADMGAQPGSLHVRTRRRHEEHGHHRAHDDDHDSRRPVSRSPNGTSSPSPAPLQMSAVASPASRCPPTAAAPGAPRRARPTGRSRYIQQGSGQSTVEARAIDDSANFSTTGTTRAVTVTGPFSVLGDAVPRTASANDPSGGRTRACASAPEVDGFVAGVRFYKGPANTGAHIGSLWDASGRATRDGHLHGRDAPRDGRPRCSCSRSRSMAGQTYTVSYTAPQRRLRRAGALLAVLRARPRRRRSRSHPASVRTRPGVYGGRGHVPHRRPTRIRTTSSTSSSRSRTRRRCASSLALRRQASRASRSTRPSQRRSLDPLILRRSRSTVRRGRTERCRRDHVTTPSTRTATVRAGQRAFGEHDVPGDPRGTDLNGVGLGRFGRLDLHDSTVELPEGECPCSLFSESVVPGGSTRLPTPRASRWA